MKSEKHWSDKSCIEMNFEEFVRWAQEYAIDKFLEDGIKGLKNAIWMIADQSARNEVFGRNANQKTNHEKN